LLCSKRLCVGGNVLKTLPSSISDLSKLEELNVADNIIEDFPPSMVLLVALKAVVTTGNAGLPKALQVNVRGMKKAQIVLDEIEKAFRGKPPLARTGTTSTMTRVGSASLPQAQPQKAFWTVKSAYAASSAQELTVAAAEQIEVVTQDPSGWWMCRRVNGQSGWLPASFLTPPAAPGSEVEERIRVGMESMLRKHQSDLVGIIKAHGPASGSIPISDQMEARMRVLENQTKDWHTELEERLVAKLEKEKEATKEERERVLTKLRQLESEGDTSSAVVTSLHRELQRFEVMQAELVVLSRSAKQREEMRTQYGSESRVWDFYNTLCVRFEEWLLGIKSAASGVVSHDVQTTGGKVGGVMCLFGELCEIIPIVGEFGAVFKAAGSVIQAVDHERQQNVIMRISKFGTLAELQNLSANLAYNLTRRYEWQLLQLQSIPDMVAARREAPKWSVRKLLQRGKQKVEQVVLDKDPKSASEALADFVLSIFIYYLTASTRDVLDPVVLEQKLFECASRPIKYELNNKVNDGLEALIKKAGGFQLETTSGQKWTFNGVLTGAGVRTPHGVFFDNGAFMFPHIYQYCVGDADEVAVRQLVPCSVVDTSRQVASFVQPPQSALVQLRSLQQTMEPQGGELRRNASGSIAPPVDNIKQTANEMFDVYVFCQLFFFLL
jgi:hypothetical protein